MGSVAVPAVSAEPALVRVAVAARRAWVVSVVAAAVAVEAAALVVVVAVAVAVAAVVVVAVVAEGGKRNHGTE